MFVSRSRYNELLKENERIMEKVLSLREERGRLYHEQTKHCNKIIELEHKVLEYEAKYKKGDIVTHIISSYSYVVIQAYKDNYNGYYYELSCGDDDKKEYAVFKEFELKKK